MARLSVKKTLLLVLAMVLGASSVAAQVLDDVFRTFADLGIVGSFQSYPQIWDAIIFLWIFGLAGREILGKQYDSPKLGSAMGIAFAIASFAGLQILGISFVRDYGPYVLVAALIALMVVGVRLVRGGQNKAVGAIGIFVITSFLVYHEPVATVLRDLNGLLFAFIFIAHILSAIFSLIWIFRHFTSAGTAPDGSGSGGLLNGLGNMLGNARDGYNHIRDNITPQQPAQNTAQLQAQIRNLEHEVQQFSTLANELVNHIHGFGAQTRSQAQNTPNDFNQQIGNRINAMSHHLQNIPGEIQAIDQADLTTVGDNEKRAFRNSTHLYLQMLQQIVGVMA